MSESMYTPRAGSLAQQATEFFRRNPDETLTLDDMVSKFGCTRGNIHTLLGPAVAHGLLARPKDDEHGYVYTVGIKDDQADPADARTPAPSDESTSASSHPAGRRASPVAWVLPDLRTAEIDTDVPLPAGRSRMPIDWPLLLDRMRPGNSRELPVQARTSLAREVAKRARETTQRFSVVKVDAAHIRIYRTA